MAAQKSSLLEKMRRSKSGWKRKDVDHLYESYGFIIENRSNHDVAKHPDYPNLPRVTLPRSRKVKKYIIRQAIKTIDRLIQLKNEESDTIEDEVEKDEKDNE